MASQGKELWRESHLYVSFAKDQEIVSKIKVGGEVLKVLEGEIYL